MQSSNFHGRLIDKQSRCLHYGTELDVVAIKFKCCNRYYACYECHREVADHEAIIWEEDEFDQQAVACGVCSNELTINEYLTCESSCPNCGAAFNPNCSEDYHFYFATRP